MKRDVFLNGLLETLRIDRERILAHRKLRQQVLPGIAGDGCKRPLRLHIERNDCGAQNRGARRVAYGAGNVCRVHLRPCRRSAQHE